MKMNLTLPGGALGGLFGGGSKAPPPPPAPPAAPKDPDRNVIRADQDRDRRKRAGFAETQVSQSSTSDARTTGTLLGN